MLLAAALGVVASLTSLPWHRYAIAVEGAGSFRLEQNGLRSPPEWLGWAALFAASVVVVAAGAARLRLSGSRHAFGRGVDLLVSLASLAVAGLLWGKFLTDLDFLGTGAWLSLALGLVMAAAGVSLRIDRTG